MIRPSRSKYASEAETVAAKTANFNNNSGPMMYVGGGPWLISPDCEAQWHNTQRAAVGRARNRPGVKCVCPRGTFLAAQTTAKANARKRRQSAERAEARREAVTTEVKIPGLTALMLSTPPGHPDLRSASCSSVMGRKLADAVTTKPLPQGAYAAHRAMCGGCPVRRACAEWALRDEGYESSKEGMWGGMSTAERRKAREAARATAVSS